MNKLTDAFSKSIIPGTGLSYEERSFVEQSAARSRALEIARRYGWPEFERHELEFRRHYVVHRPSDRLFEQITAAVVTSDGNFALADKRDVDAFYVAAAGKVIFLRRPDRAPFTLAEVEQQKRERRQAREQAEREKTAKLAAQPRRAITLAELRDRDLPTLGRAAAAVESVGGTIEAVDGELVVSIAEKMPGRGRVLDAARVLFGAAPIVLAELANNSSEPLAERLPDRAVLAGGNVEP